MDPLHESREVLDALRIMLVGINVQVRPEDGDTVEVRRTVPEKPLMLASWIVDEPELPACTVRLVGLAAMEKSGGSGKVTATVCEVVEVWPAESLTVNLTIYDPAAAYAWLAVCPEPVDPSP